MARRSRLVLVIIFAFAAGAALLASCAAATAMGFPVQPGGAEGMPLSLDAQRRVEDDASSLVEVEEMAAYPRRRALSYSGGYIGYGALTTSKAACYGPCPARGQAYSRGCEAIYHCRG